MDHHKTYSYIHGWASTPDIWKNIAKTHDSCADLGFAGTPQKPLKCDYLVTHSLGVLWALKHGIAPNKGLIVINGFYRFTDFTPVSTLKAMQLGLKRDMNAQLKSFWNNADMPESNADWDQKSLIQGLDWLAQWDEEPAIQNYDKPILILAGAKDESAPCQLQ